MFNKTLKKITLCLLSLVLIACSGSGIKPSKGPDTSVPIKLSQQAEQALLKADGSIAPQRQRHQLNAAQLYTQVGDHPRALNILADIDSLQLSLDELMEYSLLYTELALADDDFFLARQLLSIPRLEKQQQFINDADKKQWLQQRGDLFGLLGEDLKSIEAYMALSSLATSQPERVRIHDQLWQVLSNVPQQSLQTFDSSKKNAVLKGWHSLITISRKSQSDIHQQQAQIDRWRARWPNHPAATALPSSLGAIGDVIRQLPQRVALLLPLHGPLAQAGTTIRDGFLAAWYNNYEQHGNTPSARFYDTSGNTPITELYQQAVTNGAEVVIGPLQKEKVQELLMLSDLPVPVLALNYVENKASAHQPPENLYQFGLSATDEARQIAERAWIEGQRSALAIVPKSNWGERVLNAFREEWESKGGTLYVAEPYEKRQVDFAPLLKPSLHITHSEQRASRLKRLLGKSLSYTPRRRQDLDMVFMAAYPDQARQIKPTLDFLFARDLQVYGTSQLYSGKKDPGRNRDLEGIRFSAMPWTLPGGASEKLQPASDLHPLYRPMFALGIDTYYLHQWLTQMSRFPNTQLFGSTGTLQLSSKNTVIRQQPWAVFRGGKVRLAQRLTND